MAAASLHLHKGEREGLVALTTKMFSMRLPLMGFVLALLVVADGTANRSSAQDNTACGRVSLGTDPLRHFFLCRADGGPVRSSASGRLHDVYFSFGQGLDAYGPALFKMRRIDVGQDTVIDDTDFTEFLESYLVADRVRLDRQGVVGGFAVAVAEVSFFGIEEPTPCYALLKQWGKDAGGFEHQIGGFYCGLERVPDLAAFEAFLSALQL